MWLMRFEIDFYLSFVSRTHGSLTSTNSNYISGIWNRVWNRAYCKSPMLEWAFCLNCVWKHTLFCLNRYAIPPVRLETAFSLAFNIAGRLSLKLPISIPRCCISEELTSWYKWELFNNDLLGIQPTFKQVPPKVSFFSTHTVCGKYNSGHVTLVLQTNLQAQLCSFNGGNISTRTRSNDNNICLKTTSYNKYLMIIRMCYQKLTVLWKRTS